MGDRQRGATGGIVAMIVLGAVLLIGLPCLAVAALLGARLFWVARDVQVIKPPPIVQPIQPPIESEPPVMIEKLPPATNTPAPAEGK